MIYDIMSFSPSEMPKKPTYSFKSATPGKTIAKFPQNLIRISHKICINTPINIWFYVINR